MSNSAKTIIDLAKKEIGYREGKSNGSWNNNQKYSPAVPGLEWSQNQAWCATFISWLAMKSKLERYYPRSASTDAGAAWFKSQKRWSDYPAVGAQGFLGVNGDMYHTFLVTAYDKDYVYTVEGNTNNNGSSQGDGVYNLKRPRRSSSIAGYGYPAFPEGLDSADPKYKKPVQPPKVKTSRGVFVDTALKAMRKVTAKTPERKKMKAEAIRVLENFPLIK